MLGCTVYGTPGMMKHDVRNAPNLSALQGLVHLFKGFRLTRLQNYAHTQYICSMGSLLIFNYKL